MTDVSRLLEAEIPRLRRYARALTRDAVYTDDLVQNCLTRALAKQHLWRPGTDLRAWLFTILHNQHCNELRRTMREGLSVELDQASPVLSRISQDPVNSFKNTYRLRLTSATSHTPPIISNWAMPVSGSG
jgi:DNA-directed RNA polymerase specialized sigma24 family protein